MPGTGNHSSQPTDQNGNISIPSQEYQRFLYIRALEDTKNEVERWAKKRFWIITAIALLGGLSFMEIRMENYLKEDISNARIASTLAEESGKKARLAAEDAESRVLASQAQIQDLESQIYRLQTTTRTLEESIGGARRQYNELEEKIRILSDESNDAAKAADLVAQRAKSMQVKIDQFSQTLKETSDRALFLHSRISEVSDSILVAYEDKPSIISATTTRPAPDQPPSLLLLRGVNFGPETGTAYVLSEKGEGLPLTVTSWKTNEIVADVSGYSASLMDIVSNHHTLVRTGIPLTVGASTASGVATNQVTIYLTYPEP